MKPVNPGWYAIVKLLGRDAESRAGFTGIIYVVHRIGELGIDPQAD